VPADYAPPEKQEKPTPEEILAQVQAQSIQADIQKKAAELELDREKMIRSDDRERDARATLCCEHRDAAQYARSDVQHQR